MTPPPKRLAVPTSPSRRRLIHWVAGLLGVVGADAGLLADAASALHLLAPVRTAGDAVRLTIATADGTPLSMDRAARIELLASADVTSPRSRWPRVDGERSLLDGILHVIPTSAAPPIPPATATSGATFFAAREPLLPAEVRVSNAAELRAAVADARPGSRILMMPGTYPGGFFFANVRGDTNLPIVIAAADPTHPPVIQGGGTGMQWTDPQFIELHDLVIRGATDNGLNLDDGGSFDTPARNVVLRGLKVTDIGPEGNHDGIKLSGVVGFRVEGCTLERWGTGGSGIDMVGCHVGLIVSNVFRHTAASVAASGSGVQAKGGSGTVTIRRNRFEYAGSRAVNLGGSTGLQFFRPPLTAEGERGEAKDLVVEGNTFLGSTSPIAFVGVDGAVVRFNTFYRPQRWVVRILQETTSTSFVPCRNGRFLDNLIAFQSDEWSAGGVNVGPNTAPATFEFARNWWYCLDAPNRSRPSLPVPETGGVYGRSPEFRDAANGDFRLRPGSPAAGVGADALP